MVDTYGHSTRRKVQIDDLHHRAGCRLQEFQRSFPLLKSREKDAGRILREEEADLADFLLRIIA